MRIAYVLLAIMPLVVLGAPNVLAVNSVSVTPSSVEPGGMITISVDARYDWEEYIVIIIFPDGNQMTIASGKGDDTYTWTVPSYAPEGTYTVKIDSKNYEDKTASFTVVASSGGSSSGSTGNALPNEDVPEPVKNFFSRLLTLVMYIAWSVVIIAGVAAGIMFLLGKEAPQFLGRVIVAAFILSVIITVIWWLAGR